MSMTIYRGQTRPGWENGKQYSIQTQNMTGKRYSSKEDKVGVPDTRIMVWQNGSECNLITIEHEVFKTQFEQ